MELALRTSVRHFGVVLKQKEAVFHYFNLHRINTTPFSRSFLLPYMFWPRTLAIIKEKFSFIL